MNGPRKVRCSSCQKWKGGKRKLDFRYGPARINPPPESQEPWTCDRCANINEATKVRCCACPRWKNGKRPKKIIPQFAPPVGASLPAYTGADGAVDAFTGQVEQPIPLPNWTCHGCATSNLGKKARCSSCQKWKGGKRENLPWKTNPVIGMIGIVPPTIPPMAPVQLPWTCDACSHPNNGTKARCGSCQRWKGGKRTNLPSRKSNDNAGEKKDWKLPKGWEFPSEGTSVQPNTPWKCTKCGTDNNPTKLRCAGCQSWKNGRRQLLARGAPVGAGVPLNSLVPVAPTAPHFALQPTSTDPWLCSCGHQNAPTKLRCGSCQGWKNGKRNMHNNQAHQQTPPGLPQMHAAGPNIPQLPWNCHKCGKSNLATKSRCGSCQGWRGGTRQNLKQKSAEIWTCHGCERENAGNKVRCGGCQRWRGGGRPDVAARKAEKLANPHNHWTCDNCAKSNKSSKVRCGNCQRWRGGTVSRNIPIEII